MKGWKTVLGAGALAGAVEYGIAAYFFRRTMLRQNATTERTMEMSGTNWAAYIPMMEVMKEWMLKQPREDVYIRSEDGLRLHATYFPGKGGKEACDLLPWLYQQGDGDHIGLSNYYLQKGYQMLLVDERAHGDSEGTYIGFGCLDRRDALLWIRYGEERLGKDCEIWASRNLYGRSHCADGERTESCLPQQKGLYQTGLLPQPGTRLRTC